MAAAEVERMVDNNRTSTESGEANMSTLVTPELQVEAQRLSLDAGGMAATGMLTPDQHSKRSSMASMDIQTASIHTPDSDDEGRNSMESVDVEAPTTQTPESGLEAQRFSIKSLEGDQPAGLTKEHEKTRMLVGSMEVESPKNDVHELGDSQRYSFDSVGADTPTAQTPTLETPIMGTHPFELESSPYTDERTASPEPQTPTGPITPTTPHTPTRNNTFHDVNTDRKVDPHMSMASMASIALSETSLDYDHLSTEQVDECLTTPRASGRGHTRRVSSLEILQNTWAPARQSTLFDSATDADTMSLYQPDDLYGDRHSSDVQTADAVSLRSGSTASINIVKTRSASTATSSSAATPRRASEGSDEAEEVNWKQLERNEQQEKDDKLLPEGAEDESTRFLLARLEQENAILASDPKTHASRAVNTRTRSQSRPPSMAHLKKLVKDREAPSIRYSMASTTITEDAEDDLNGLPEDPPPMTELEFWAALVQDYPSTASRLPTLTTSKIRAGIPPPLRGVVWTSMAGARDKYLETQYEKLLHEKSPYEGIINKDVGRSFPGVELFRDAEGEGQKMLGRVLKCFSLQDRDIGYCQGLGFLVGPLLMNMGERDAFCVLVRLMHNFALRPSFLPSLSGLHMRIFQFSSLLDQHQPELSAHLAAMGVEPAYLSQWFLSCFAVTCPLPMLFRIYDVIFAEGANETVMRVALALMRRNEVKMMEAVEFEEVMQLLLGRGIWDVYGCSADELVDDFTSLGHIITHERLAELEREFESKDAQDVGKSAGFLPDVQAAASRFLGRLWAPSHNASKSTNTLSPSSAEKDATAASGGFRGSFLRKSPSKQSISTINDSEGTLSSGSGSASLASTAPTEADAMEGATRESAADTLSLKSKPESMRTASVSMAVPPTPTGFSSSKEQQDLHGQIEDLLTALSEMQREHAQLAAMLQKEREDRSEDHRIVRHLVGRLQVDDTAEKVSLVEDRRRTMPPAPKRRASSGRPKSLQIDESHSIKDLQGGEADELSVLLQKVDDRLHTNARFSASFESKAQLKSSLTRTREQLEVESTRARDLSEQLEVSIRSQTTFELEAADLRDQVADLRIRVNDEFKERQKLEHTVRELKAETRKLARTGSMADGIPTLSSIDTAGVQAGRGRHGSLSSTPTPAGLRELKLGRRDSSSSVQSIRSVRNQQMSMRPDIRPPSPANANVNVPAATSPVVTPTVSTSPTGQTAPPPAPETPQQPTPTPTSGSQAHKPSGSLSVPTNTSDRERAVVWGRRTTSLATQTVLATPEHEPANEDQLLVELVNAKTAEATARQELDEMKRNLNVQKRRHDEDMAKMQLEMANALAQAQVAAREEAEKARMAEREASIMSAMSASAASTPGLEDGPVGAAGESEPGSKAGTPLGTPGAETPPEVRVDKAKTAPAGSGGGGGWFWSRRTPSTSVSPAKEG